MEFSLPGGSPDLKQAVERFIKQRMGRPFWLWGSPTADLPTDTGLGANEGAIAYDETVDAPVYRNASAWVRLSDYDAAVASIAALSIVQGDLIYGSAADTFSRLAKDTNATRYLSNTGASNNPAWAQINLANGVTGDLPFANIAQISDARVLGNFTGGTADIQQLSTTGTGNVVMSASPTFTGIITAPRANLQNTGASASMITDRTDGKIAIFGGGGSSVTIGYDNTGIFKIESNSRANIEAGSLGTGATTRLQIDSSGNVAIGATAASAKLDVDGDIYPTVDNSYYLGRNDDDTPKAWKGVILKDTTNGKYYRIEVISGVITATDLTD